jgi:glycosyltransferase involved in cell wall biosynthesis
MINKFFYLKGGSERVFFQERDFLIDYGIKVTDFSMVDENNYNSPNESFFVDKIDYNESGNIYSKLRIGKQFIHSSQAVEKIKSLLKACQPQIAHLHNIYHQLTPAIIPVIKSYNIPIILTLHDGKLLCPNYLMLKNDRICTSCKGRSFWKAFTNLCGGSYGRSILLCIEAYWHMIKRSYRYVDLFISPSQFLCDLIQSKLQWADVHILHNGIDLKNYMPQFTDNGYALYFGRLSKEKGIKTLLKAWESINQPNDLRIVGTGDKEIELRRQYSRVQFLGHLTGPELKKTISNAAFVVVPSEWYENCSMVVLEAMALGKPVIGSRIGGIPEQVIDGENGLLFEPGNFQQLAEKMRILSSNSELRNSFGRAARNRVEQQYSFEKHCTGLRKIYADVLERQLRTKGVRE